MGTERKEYEQRETTQSWGRKPPPGEDPMGGGCSRWNTVKKGSGQNQVVEDCGEV